MRQVIFTDLFQSQLCTIKSIEIVINGSLMVQGQNYKVDVSKLP